MPIFSDQALLFVEWVSEDTERCLVLQAPSSVCRQETEPEAERTAQNSLKFCNIKLLLSNPRLQ